MKKMNLNLELDLVNEAIARARDEKAPMEVLRELYTKAYDIAKKIDLRTIVWQQTLILGSCVTIAVLVRVLEKEIVKVVADCKRAEYDVAREEIEKEAKD